MKKKEKKIIFGNQKIKRPRNRIGSMMKKVLLLLSAGFQLSFSKSPAGHFYILRTLKKEWREIDSKSLYLSVKNLYRSKLIFTKDKPDGTVEMVLSEQGKKRVLACNIETIKLPRQEKWDGLWRMVIFDIPEKNKKGRDAFAKTLKKLGFHQLQKSVFIYPHHCQDEIEFLIEFFNLRPFIRVLLAKSIDNELHLKKIFRLD